MKEKKISITEKILEKLREDLLEWNYNINQLITEAEISERFGVSKTPAREALNYLCMENLLEKIPHVGYIVKGISLADTERLFEYRLILEVGAIELAIEKADKKDIENLQGLAKRKVAKDAEEQYKEYNQLNYEFHIAIASLSKNQYLIDSIEYVLRQLYRALALDWKTSDVNRLLEGHEQIVKAIEEKNIEKAKKYIEEECLHSEHRINMQEKR